MADSHKKMRRLGMHSNDLKKAPMHEDTASLFSDPSLYINRELSWLEFNQRVLEEAQDPSSPLLKRLKFLVSWPQILPGKPPFRWCDRSERSPRSTLLMALGEGGLTLKFGCPSVIDRFMDNEFAALDDFGIDNQLRSWGNCPSFADVLIRSRERAPLVVIVLVLFLDEVVKKALILLTDVLSQVGGVRRIQSLGHHVSSERHR